jgi:methanogenic corrinoid protein MtbC1
MMSVTQEAPPALVRIGELSRRVGLSEHVLRAWETRYGLLRPERSAGRFRLYSASDEARVRRMQAHLADGLSAAEAARAVLAEAPAAGLPAQSGDRQRLAGLYDGLEQALDDFDEPAAQARLDSLLAEFTVETVLTDVVVPYLHEVGERWERGQMSVAQEHFAVQVLRGRLTGLARGWGGGQGPHAVLACPPGEMHDLGLMIFGVALRRAGWRVSYLGADTPLAALLDAAERLRPDVVVLAATAPEHFTTAATELTRLARLRPLVIAGAGAREDLAESIEARLLPGDPVSGAGALRP